jgi:hypothetical protein
MADAYPPTKQREALLGFALALGCRDNALRRDDCGDWRINGSHGHIYAVLGSVERPTTPGFQIYVRRDSVREWSAARKALTTAQSGREPFCNLTNDGDDEGMLFLERLPTPAEAETIRRYCGIAKKQTYSEEQLVGMRERMRGLAAGQFQPKQPVSGDPERPLDEGDGESDPDGQKAADAGGEVKIP